jgi:tRNA pseudouridine38-40 synthase
LDSTQRFKLLIAYDGAPFLGWQSQVGGNTVQDVLEAALIKLCGKRIPLHGSGRTDTGVHAWGQVAHFELESSPRKIDWRNALNAHLPPSIRVMECSPVPQDFHARFSAIGKIYTYRICNGPVQDPFEFGRSWHLPAQIDYAMLAQCCAQLAGTHDFGGFAANRGKPELSTVRTVSRIEPRREGPMITIVFEGTGFLYKMVRLLTGSIMRCAQHRAGPEWLREILECKRKSSFAAPAHGLYLTRVLY